MFIEPQLKADRKGWIEVICGSMFSGKTEELIRRLRRVKIANLQVEIFKPAIDTRYDKTNIVSHDEKSIHSTPVAHSSEIIPMAANMDVVGIDEAQFFDSELPMVCDQLALRGIRVIVAGLDTDYLGKPFGIMPELLAKAEYITKVHAICVKCGNIANHSHRVVVNADQILLGEKDAYEPLCRYCYDYATKGHNPSSILTA